MISIFRTQYQKAKDFYLKYERLLMPATLVFGFIVDYLTFTNIQINIALSILLGHFVLAGATIVFIHYYDSGRVASRLKFIRLFAPLLIQFTFGALLGASFIFYWFSGSFSVSWPFITVIAVLMVSNDVFRHYFLKTAAQIGIYYFIAFSFFSLALPFIFNSLSVWLFLFSGIASLALIYAYLRLLYFLSGAVREQNRLLTRLVLAIFVIMNALYFANIIPPIPLALRQAGVYHQVKRTNSGYILTGEPENFWQKFIPGQTLRLGSGERAYVYTAIFAPADLKTRIYHRWQYYDENTGEWIDKDRLSFAVSGGRKQGYRGYSAKSAVAPGRWRVSVETERGQALGRVKFKIEKTESAPELVNWSNR